MFQLQNLASPAPLNRMVLQILYLQFTVSVLVSPAKPLIVQQVRMRLH